MPHTFTRADSLREYLTGAASDGGAQTNPSNALGNYRSATEALSLGITIQTPITGVAVNYASGGNPVGNGILTAIDANNLTWQPAGASQAGPPTSFSGASDQEIVEAYQAPGQYLRVTGSTPFTPGASTIILAYLMDNFFGFDDVTVAEATAGESEYRATMLRNEAANSAPVSGIQRWINPLAGKVTPDSGALGASGSGTLVTSGSFAAWPAAGWVRVESSSGTLKEIVYYTSRTNTTLTVPSAGRALLGTTATAGSTTDNIWPVPGVAIGLDSAGVQAFGSSIQTIANANTAPTGITWNVEIVAANGLQIALLNASQQIGIWMWRQVPPGAVSTGFQLTQLLDNFNAF